MLILTVLAGIGLAVVIGAAYRRGKADGIRATIDYFAEDMEKQKVDVEQLDSGTSSVSFDLVKAYKKIRHTGKEASDE